MTPANAPNPPTPSRPARVPVMKIRIDQAEGTIGSLVHADAFTFSDANAWLRKIADSAPANGSYYKTDVNVTWADGFTVYLREDVVSIQKAAPDLMRSIRRMWSFYAGFWRPDHIDQEKYDAMVAAEPERRDQATKALMTYALEDAPETIAKAAPASRPPKLDPAPQPIAIDPHLPELEWFENTLVTMGSLIRGYELPANVARFRPVSLEMRKAMAALLRARAAILKAKGG